MHDQHLRQGRDQADSREIAHWIVGWIAHHLRGDERALGDHDERVTVRRRARDVSESYGAVRARTVLHVDALAESFARLFRDRTTDQIEIAAGLHRHHEADRL